MEQKEKIQTAVEYIAGLPVGTVIEHQEIKSILGIKEPVSVDFENDTEFIEALKMHQFEYMGSVEKIKDILLTDFQTCLKNEKGVGYYTLVPTEQINYGIKTAKNGIKKKIKHGTKIIVNVNFHQVAANERQYAHDNLAKLSMLRQMLR